MIINRTYPITLVLLALVSLSACATTQSKEIKPALPITAHCGYAGQALKALEHGDPSSIGAVVQNITCYDGAQAESAEGALGGMIATHPTEVFSALEKYHTPSVVVGDIAASPPSRYVDKFCELLHVLEGRSSTIKSMKGFSDNREIAIAAINQFEDEVEPHCINGK